MIERFEDWQTITFRRAQVLALLAANRTEAEIAAELGITASTAHRHVYELREAVGCASGRELGRWWQTARSEWLAAMAEIAGVRVGA